MDQIWHQNYGDMSKDIEWQSLGSMADVIEAALSKFAGLPAVHCLGTTLNYGEIDSHSRDLAAYLQSALGHVKGDRVAIMLPNIMAFNVASFAVIRGGMVQVNVNPLYTPRELKHQLNDAGVETIIIAAMASATLGAILSETSVKNIITVQIADLIDAPVPPAEIDAGLENTTTLTDALATGAKLPFTRPHINQDDLLFLQYTGGTTGLSKGAMLTHGNLASNMAVYDALAGAITEEGREIIITPVPMYHILALMVSVLSYTRYGALNVLIPNPRDMDMFVGTTKKFKFTAMVGVNTLYNGLLHTPAFAEVDCSGLKVAWAGGATVMEAVSNAWKERTGVHIKEGYGLSETSPVVSMNLPADDRFNSTIGVVVPSTIVSIRDDAGAELAQGEAGEICIKGPQVMQGYWNRPDATAEVMTDDGFFKSGDIGMFTDSGLLKIVDRKKDMILVSGFNVFPNEIEAVVSAMPGVMEAACVGVPDERSGEAVKLFVVPSDALLNTEDVITHCRNELAAYKVPREVVFLDELPKSTVGKVLRRALRDQ
ncbi:AMP-binding protein [Lentibacter sp.]|uniref:AMP-binding protein n=1 Tax=Lentibacter sp. TaxID=2024994 RepID=UPI003F6970CE